MPFSFSFEGFSSFRFWGGFHSNTFITNSRQTTGNKGGGGLQQNAKPDHNLMPQRKQEKEIECDKDIVN